MNVECGDLKERLNSILMERDRLFPERDPQNTEKMQHHLGLFLTCLLGNRADSNWSPDQELTEKAQSFQENGIFLCGSMKSGTTLLLELLDGHPELTVMPGDSWFWARLNESSKQNYLVKDWQRHWLQRMVNPTGQTPFWILGENEDNYKELLNYFAYWFTNLPNDVRRPILTSIFSYYCANKDRSLDSRFWVEKTPGNEIKVASLVESFPKAKFLHIIRDPRENLASIKRLYRTRGWKWKARSVAYGIARSFKSARDNQEKYGNTRYLTIRYEDLTADPPKSMQMVSSFIGINWSDTCLTPTVNGLPAKANTMYKDREVVGIIRPSVSDKWRQELSFLEQGLIHQVHKYSDSWEYSFNMNKQDILKKIVCGWLLPKV